MSLNIFGKMINDSFLTDRDCRTLFAKNLPFKITQDDLREIFEDAVDIRIPVARDGSGTRGYVLTLVTDLSLSHFG